MELHTKDIVLAAYLKCTGHTIVSIDIDKQKGTFIFEIEDNSIIDQFNLGNASVEPVSFNNTIKMLTTACRRP